MPALQATASAAMPQCQCLHELLEASWYIPLIVSQALAPEKNFAYNFITQGPHVPVHVHHLPSVFHVRWPALMNEGLTVLGHGLSLFLCMTSQEVTNKTELVQRL